MIFMKFWQLNSGEDYPQLQLCILIIAIPLIIHHLNTLDFHGNIMKLGEKCFLISRRRVFEHQHGPTPASSDGQLWPHGPGTSSHQISAYFKCENYGHVTRICVMKMVRMMIVNQIAALKWLQQNIKHFGGDPELVTLFGYRHGHP